MLVHESLVTLELGVSDNEMADARKDRRTLLSLKIRYKSATLEDFIERYSMDISRGGVFIKAKRPLAVGTLLKFEFMLQDQSTLIHGVGRVAWRREEADADANNPSGMGIKFIKMDPESRSVVQRIVEDRARPGVFEQGKEGVSPEPAVPSVPDDLNADPTTVRHVSEFLASALEEGGAGPAATREAQAGAERARQASKQRGAAGVFGAPGGSGAAQRHASDAPARGAMSAFGGASMSASTGMRSSAAPAMEELDAEDDFLDDETTKVQQLPTSDFPDAAATVVASEVPFLAEKRQTPVVPANVATQSSSPLQDAVPDLFGPDSFGPAPGELIDASLLDPAVATVPPKASALPRGAVPDASGIPTEAFKVPQAPTPVDVAAATPTAKKGSRGWLVALLFVVFLAAAGVAAWQLGLTDDVVKMAEPYLGRFEAVVQVAPEPKPTPTPVQAAQQEPAASDAPTEVEAGAPEKTPEAEPEAASAPAAVAEAGPVKLRVISVPSGAFVSINGKGAGRTPLDVEYEAGAKLSLFSKARGYLARRQQVTVSAEQPEVKLVLPPLPWVVEVETTPAGARATAVGGGETTTPGQLRFKSIAGTKKIVISKDGYGTVTKSVSRLNFVEERTRMAASVRATLPSEGASASAEPAPAPEPVEAVEAKPVEAPAAAEAPPAPEPEPVDEAPAPSEPTDVDAP